MIWVAFDVLSENINFQQNSKFWTTLDVLSGIRCFDRIFFIKVKFDGLSDIQCFAQKLIFYCNSIYWVTFIFLNNNHHFMWKSIFKAKIDNIWITFDVLFDIRWFENSFFAWNAMISVTFDVFNKNFYLRLYLKIWMTFDIPWF